MGRSKFPGKPSKSINRKRISVLQLDEEDIGAGGSGTGGAGSATTTASVEEQQQRQRQQQQEQSSEQDTTATHKKSNNCKNNEDDDDDDNAPSAGGGGGNISGGGNATATTSSGATTTTTQGNGTASGTEDKNGGRSSVNGEGGGGGDKCATLAHVADSVKFLTKNKLLHDSNSVQSRQMHDVMLLDAAANMVDKKNVVAAHNDVDNYDNDNEEDDDDDDDDDDVDNEEEAEENGLEEQAKRRIGNKKSTSSASSMSAFGVSASALRIAARRSSNKKFKNLNLARAEVMLPSTSKLKQQQQQLQQLELNCPSMSSPATASASVATSTLMDTGRTSKTTTTTLIAAPTATTATSVVTATATTSTTTTGTSINPFAALGAIANISGNSDMEDAFNNAVALQKKTHEMDTVPNVVATPVTGNASASPTTSGSGGGGVNAADSGKNASIAMETNTTMSAASVQATAASKTAPVVSTTKQKKTVTFKNILEMSDDKNAIKRFYNPDNRTPLVSIMKKECMNRPLSYSRNSECIVRPSILSKILNKNSNIDKLNSLKFRSVPSASATTSSLAASSSASTSVGGLFGSALSRAFGAPAEGEDENTGGVTFRLNKHETSESNEDGGDDDDDDEDNNDNDEEGEEQLENRTNDAEFKLELKRNEDYNSSDESTSHSETEDTHNISNNRLEEKLPKRSNRMSSRIIKTNSRRLVENCNNTAGANGSKRNSHSSSSSSVTSKAKKEPTNFFGMGGDYANAANLQTVSLGIKHAKDASNAFSNFTSSMKLNSFVLRQPRLQFESLAERSSNSALPKSALSPTTTSSAISSATFGALNSAVSNVANSQSTTETCNVCGTSIPSKYMQQSRKYGTIACEVCRKFVSKMRKSSQQQLQCKSDNGTNCSIQSSTKGYPKNFKKLYKERCTACWLKKCLQVFQLTPEYKFRLNAILPPATTLSKSKSEKAEISLKLEKSSTVEMLSPTSSGVCFGTARLNSNSGGGSSPSTSTSTVTEAQIKWKSKVEQSTATADSLKLINPLKLNPLLENNVTFGSTPLLLRPAILESSLFHKTNNDVTQKRDECTTESTTTIPKTTDTDATIELTKTTVEESSKKQTKLTRKAKLDKDKSKDFDVTPKTVDSSSNVSKTSSSSSLSPVTATATVTSSAIVAAATSNPTPNTTTIVPTENSGNNSPSGTTGGSESLKRQRIDLKGPRVKHVCRSASIVLGQPIATFGEDEQEMEMETDDATVEKSSEIMLTNEKQEACINNESKSSAMVTDENDNCASCKQPVPETVPTKTSVTNPKTIEKSSKSEQSTDVTSKSSAQQPLQPTTKANTRNTSNSASSASSSTAVTKKYLRHTTNGESTSNNQLQVQQQQQLQPTGKRSVSIKENVKPKTFISIDFWENYDPAEVCQTGFGLIVTETVAQRALCFLCGATGLDPLMFCACCCEPYHQYCVLDEYNLKHSSFDDTLLNSMLLDTSTNATGALMNNSNAISHITNRLNWLCPRCTVCYTCNMSSGSKVRCQKCQKNYHTTCLGTSKRLLGADRPLICVNCLKCKSCATTKVSKFVGNLPMCTPCFKLRKKGNYCPICQKCYDDNDFDLKMMECGDCKQWVHSKCEGLSDEQYNLLSTLPESIEFICKKCARRNESSKHKAEEWRLAVIEEFKSSLLSVLKLLSKSRQACALLKLSPRKKMRCTCVAQNGNGKIQPKALQFIPASGSDNLGSDGESQCSDDIYEFKDQPANSQTLNSNAATLTAKSSKVKCTCIQSTFGGTTLSLVDIKQKISSNSYVSLAEFNYDMNNVIQQANCDELVIAYKELLSEQFPWFQNETKACTDALEDDMFESCGYSALNSDINDAPTNYIGDTDPGSARNIIDIPADVEDINCILNSRVDMRVCLFCRKTGEGLPNEESRLLYCGHDCWVHTNCAMWSAEVFEEIDGSLQNVHSAVSRGRMIKCTVCGNRGATVGCNVKSCGEHYHYPCARSIECAFLTDKSMYCPAHAKNALKFSATPNVTFETNFDVSRPVYVELDRKRKKLIEPMNVQFHIGSLEVKQLGTIVPRFSDTFEAVIPINFLCNRLYWSSKEPWKIVEYTVRTTIQNSFSTLTMDAGRNFTVDHSNPNTSLVQLGLAQIARWHNSLARGDLMDVDWGNAAEIAALSKLLPEYMNQTLSSYNATDENTEDEPQNNADLLPPEIKDAIFEDLPHELLDGISMLDLFMYDDLGDAKTEIFALSEQSKDGINNATVAATVNTGVASTSSAAASNMQISDEDTINSTTFGKQLELNSPWTTNNLTVNHVEDAMLSAVRSTMQAKQRSKSTSNSVPATVTTATVTGDLLKKATGVVPQTRNWTKLDGSSVAAIKRRKLSKGFAEGMLLSLNQQRNKKETATVAGISRRQSICTGELSVDNTNSTLRSKTFTWSAAKHYIEPNTTDTTKDDASKLKIMQMDGVDDSITEYRIITTTSDTSATAAGQFVGQVKCERCQCTYRNYESFQRHLATCEPMSTSESESEHTPSVSEHLNTTTTTTFTSESFNELQKQAAAAASLPFLQATFPQVQNLTTIGNLQNQLNTLPLASLQGLQGVQGLQGLQNLQLQQLQPQPLGGGFFLSQANPNTQTTAQNNATDELQMYANSLQGLAANLNGGFTLTQPTVTAAPAQPTQFIAVSNPDGTQQFIQLPQGTNGTAQLLQAANATSANTAFQTLQTNNCDKKIILPVNGKPLKTMTAKAVQQATVAAKQKQLKAAANGVKPIQAKLVAPSTQAHQTQAPITLLNAATANNNAQLLSQNLLQPQLLFQTAGNTATAQPTQQILMSQPQPQNIISFVTSDGSQNPPQLQYVSIPTTNDYKPQHQTTTATPTFLTAAGTTGNANQLLQGTTFLQTDASGNLVLTTAQAPTGLQMLTASAPMSTGQPQVIGTLIQPQTLQLAGGNVQLSAAGSDGTNAGTQQQQLIIGGGGATTTTGLEFTTAPPQVILATQPMYYGLETIVQNTVMSSQQFVSTAMPGVLSQNASFSATTTQVFQASKIEPIVDIPAGYVVLNNACENGATAGAFLNAANAVLQPQQTTNTTATTLDDATQQLFRIQAATTDQTLGAPNATQFQFQQQHHLTTEPTIVATAKIPPVAQMKRPATAKPAQIAAMTKVQPQHQAIVNKVLPTNFAQQQQQLSGKTGLNSNVSKTNTQYQRQLAANTSLPTSIASAVSIDSTKSKPQLTPSGAPTSIASKPLQNRRTNLIRPINKVEVKPKVMKAAAANVKSNNQQQQQQHSQLQPLQQTTTQTQLSNNAKTTMLKIDNASVPPLVVNLGETTISSQPLQEEQKLQQSIQQQQQPQLQQLQQYPITTIADATVTATNTGQFYVAPNNITNLLDTNQQQLTYHINNNNNNNACNAGITEISSCNINNRLQQFATNNVPTNIVSPLQQQQQLQQNTTVAATTTQSITINTRPTNRVLPMQQRQESISNINTSAATSTHSTLTTKSTLTTNTLTSATNINAGAVMATTQQKIIAKQQQYNGQVEQQPQKCLLYEAEEEKPMQVEICLNPTPLSPAINITAAAASVLEQQQLEPNMNIVYEKQLDMSVQIDMKSKNDEQILMETCEPQVTITHVPDENADYAMLAKRNYELAHLNMETNDECMENDLLSAAHKNYNEFNGHCNVVVDAGIADDTAALNGDEHVEENEVDGDDDDDEDDDDDDFSLKMPTPDGRDHEMSDGEEPAVKEKISKILDNLTNDDCGESIATATTVEATALAELQNDAGYQQMVEDVLATTVTTVSEPTINDDNMINYEATPEETAAVEAAVTAYINEMAEVHQLELNQLQSNLEKSPEIISEIDTKQVAEALAAATVAEQSNTMQAVIGTSVSAPPIHPPMTREAKKISGPHLLYEIQSEDGFTYKSTSIVEIWEKVFEAVQVARRAHGLSPLPEGPLADMSGVQMIGLKTNALKYLIEQLPGVEKCSKYTPKYHKRSEKTNCNSGSLLGSANGLSGNVAVGHSSVNTLGASALLSSGDINGALDYSSDQDDLIENPYECARNEPYTKRSEYDMFSWLASRHRKQPIQVFVQPSDTELVPRRGTGSNLPMAMKYRTLKETYKDYVGVFRSHIHGRGLYCTKDIEAGEMVIEYAGELIRSTLTDKRERYYDSRGIGCYMFKIDENLVVDATMRGNAARFINHSCEPNCYSKVVDILGHKHIIIFALRRIVQGEELTYDYKFPFEDEKIPCSCGSKKCRKYLN